MANGLYILYGLDDQQVPNANKYTQRGSFRMQLLSVELKIFRVEAMVCEFKVCPILSWLCFVQNRFFIRTYYNRTRCKSFGCLVVCILSNTSIGNDCNILGY